MKAKNFHIRTYQYCGVLKWYELANPTVWDPKACYPVPPMNGDGVEWAVEDEQAAEDLCLAIQPDIKAPAWWKPEWSRGIKAWKEQQEKKKVEACNDPSYW